MEEQKKAWEEVLRKDFESQLTPANVLGMGSFGKGKSGFT